MSFALRAIFVISPHDSSVIFERRFNSVEIRAKRLNPYVAIPETNPTFLTALLTEIGVKDIDKYVSSRDGCDRPCWAPAFELKLETGGTLGPVVVLQHRGLLLCAIPIAEWTIEKEQRSFFAVAQTMDCLSMLAEVLSDDLTQRSLLRHQLLKFTTIAVPFGQPVALTASLCEQIFSAGSREAFLGKVKQPVWNPISPRGKNQLSFHITEQVHCELINTQSEGKIIQSKICGTIWVTVGDISVVKPEVSLILSHPTKINKFTLSPNAQITVQSDETTTLMFCPSPASRTVLCHYSVMNCVLPVEGNLIVTQNSDSAQLQLTLQPSKAPLSKLEISLSSLSQHSIKPVRVPVGVATEEGCGIKWDIPVSKLKSKAAPLIANISLGSDDTNTATCLSEIFFKIPDQAWSGCKILPHSVTVSSSNKVKSSFSAETTSGYYHLYSKV